MCPAPPKCGQAQEDIWIYKALLTIIKRMNEGTYFARVRRISDIAIGPGPAAEYQQGISGKHIEKLKSAAAAAPADAAPAPAAIPEGEGVAKAIDEGRYVDPDGKPLPSGSAALLQFKRMPIFMSLTMDQREINKLLVECANAPLPVEVRQLRINPLKGNGPSSKKSGSGGCPRAAARPDNGKRNVRNPHRIDGNHLHLQSARRGKTGRSSGRCGCTGCRAGRRGPVVRPGRE